VASSEGDGSDGLAEVVDAGGRLLARGIHSPDSQIVARLWTFDGRPVDSALFRERFAAARRLRDDVLPPQTTGYRAVNSEGDLCPGVLLDVYGDAAVLELTTSGAEARRAELEAAAREVFAPGRLVVRETGSARDRKLSPSPPAGGEGFDRLAGARRLERSTEPRTHRPSTTTISVRACALRSAFAGA